jgi:hypothetical protein
MPFGKKYDNKNIISGELREVEISATFKRMLIVGNPFLLNLDIFDFLSFQSGQTITPDEVQC